MATPLRLKDLSKQEEKFAAGHRLCKGCPEGIVVRMTLLAAGDRPLVLTNATSCLEVSTALYPYTSWKVPWYHNAFENSAATASGIEAATKALKRRGKLDRDVAIIAFGGDGGTYDIGFQALSGMAERGHKVVYICYDNEAYMNTGIQRSGATPLGAWTTTSHAGSAHPGKREGWRKDVTAIMVAHGIPYAADATIGYWRDYMGKVQKALEANGPAFIDVLSPCWRGWRFDPAQTLEIARLAVDTNFWPLYEVVEGRWRQTHTPREVKPIEEFLKTQGRFSHFFRPGGEALLEEWRRRIDLRNQQLQARIQASQQVAIY